MSDRIMQLVCGVIALSTLLCLVLLVAVMAGETADFFNIGGLIAFLTEGSWEPLLPNGSFGIKNMLAGTLYVTLLALAMALVIGTGTALGIILLLPGRIKYLAAGLLDIMAGLPSVIYGFIGMTVVLGWLESCLAMQAGDSVLAAGIVLAVMLLPYVTAACLESMDRLYRKYRAVSAGLGVSRAYMLLHLVLPASKRAVAAAGLLALARGLGETMAVLMVIGNANIFPELCGKASTIPAKLALEMGMAAVGSRHYQALFAAALVLIIITVLFNLLSAAVWQGLRRRE